MAGHYRIALARMAQAAVVSSVWMVAGAGGAFAEDQGELDALIDQGRKLALTADCAACHTAPKGGAEMAGGYAIVSPLGTIWSSNITPSTSAGIGGYSEAEFARALREGVAKDGTHLYPAMPYSAYARITDADVHALYTYFMKGVAPVDTPAPKTTLPFPFNIRASMAGWNLLFGKDPLPEVTGPLNTQQQRGEYLANGLAHCATCHTPRNAAMGLSGSQSLAGADVGIWHAPNITSDKLAGIGAWSDAEIAAYLKTGRAEGRAQAAGPMAEAVEHSLQHLDDSDIDAIVAYLRQVKPVQNASVDRSTVGKPVSDDNVVRGLTVESGLPLADGHEGATLYAGNCAACHTPSGAGSFQQFYPALSGNSTVGATNPTNLVATILEGVDRTTGGHRVFMPGFGPEGYVNRLSYDEVAQLTNYVTGKWGQGDAGLTGADVKLIAEGGPKPLIAKLAPWLAYAGIAVLILVLLALAVWVIRPRSKKEA